jgi:hypothetical protein
MTLSVTLPLAPVPHLGGARRATQRRRLSLRLDARFQLHAESANSRNAARVSSELKLLELRDRHP